MKSIDTPIVKDLVLIGGGHSHLAVLKYFGMNPMPGVRLTLIARDLHTPYSGMLPGFIAGHYERDQAHIDLRPLALFACSRIYHTEAQGLDLQNNRVLCSDRPPVPFDVLSIDIGSRPGAVHIPGAERYSIPVKPIDRFLSRWDQLVQDILVADGKFQLAVVGGGAGGVELVLSTQYRLHQELKRFNRSTDFLEHHLITESPAILPSHNAKVRRKFEQVLNARNINIHVNHRVEKMRENEVCCSGGIRIPTDAVILVTSASAPSWLAHSGLQVDPQGFIAVNDYLQSPSHSNVFATGDIASMVNHPRPKAGVFAVRQGPPLARNLALALQSKPLQKFTPQKQFLSLISTGDRYAIASRANWSIEGQWVWRLKDWIDRRFMQKYSDLPAMMDDSTKVDSPLADETAVKELSAATMRCGGCGAKIGSTVLTRVIQRLQPKEHNDVVIGLNAPDDAAVTQVPADKLLVQSVDYFRSFIDDPYLFGKIAANHALGDIFAMGGEARWAMAIATLPFGIENQVEEQLFQLMSGAMEVLNDADAALIGGHSSEGSELSFGLAVSGLVDKSQLLRKAGMRTGDLLILTKPLGTGVLFAADMRLQAKGRWIDGALQNMLLSNLQAGRCLHRYGVTSCTDVTGFGLLGHLVEMSRASGMDVCIKLNALPILDGALTCAKRGIFSSLQPQNIRLRRAIKNTDDFAAHVLYPLIFDPQTAGGLLASVPAHQAQPCVEELLSLGYKDTAVIGEVLNASHDEQSVVLET